MVAEKYDCFPKVIKVIFYYIKNQVCIDVEIAMGYMVADTHNLFPGNFASDRK